MEAKAPRIGTLAALGGGLLIIRWRRERGRAAAEPDRWHFVTINLPLDEVLSESGPLPRPLADLGDKVVVEARRAPGGRGTELGARLIRPVPIGLRGIKARIDGRDPRQPLSRALRESKSLLEAGEVVSPHKPPTIHKPLTGS